MDINYYRQYEPIFGAWSVTRLVSEDSLGAVFEIERSDSGVSRKAALRAITIPPGRHESGMDSAQDAEIKSSTRNYLVGVINDLVREISLLQQLKGTSNLVSYGEHLVIEHRDGVGWDILVRMERLTPLEDYLAQHAVTQREVIRLGIDLCRALEACWQSQIAYHDVKPENIFVSAQGDFKLGGLCSEKLVWMTAQGGSSPALAEYTAPEVYRGEEGGRAADVYSLGLVLYRLLNGNRLPFLSAQTAVTPEGRREALTRRLSGAPFPPPAYAQGALAGVVGKACACDPRERYAGPAELRRALEDLLLYPEQEETPPAPKPATAKADSGSEERASSPGGLRNVLAELRRKAPARSGGTAALGQKHGDAILPVFLAVFLANVPISYALYYSSNPLSLFIALGLLFGLLVYICLNCSRKTVFLSSLGMYTGILAVWNDMVQMFSSWYAGESVIANIIHFQFEEPLEHRETWVLVITFFVCLLLCLLCAKKGWSGRRKTACVAGCTLLICFLIDLIWEAPGYSSIEDYMLTTEYFVHLLHVLGGSVFLSLVADSAMQHGRFQWKTCAYMTGSSLIIFFLTAKLFTWIDHNFYIPYVLFKLLIAEFVAAQICSSVCIYTTQHGWTKRRTYAVAVISFMAVLFVLNLACDFIFL